MEIKKYEFDGVIVEEEMELSLDDLCRACAVNTEWIIMLVNEGVLDPLNASTDQWRFDGTSLRRVRTVRRLQQDLDVNLAGAALALELLEELEALRERLAALETHDD
jgi:chaperone modulatory protein CbpM